MAARLTHCALLRLIQHFDLIAFKLKPHLTNRASSALSKGDDRLRVIAIIIIVVVVAVVASATTIVGKGLTTPGGSPDSVPQK